MKRKIKRLKLDDDDTPPRKKVVRIRLGEKDTERRRARHLKPAHPKFVELMRGIASTSPEQRRRAARRLAAHCAVVFKEES